jgi:hypothetical protein
MGDNRMARHEVGLERQAVRRRELRGALDDAGKAASGFLPLPFDLVDGLCKMRDLLDRDHVQLGPVFYGEVYRMPRVKPGSAGGWACTRRSTSSARYPIPHPGRRS